MLKESASSAATNVATTAAEVALENVTTRIKLDVVSVDGTLAKVMIASYFFFYNIFITFKNFFLVHRRSIDCDTDQKLEPQRLCGEYGTHGSAQQNPFRRKI